VMMAVLRCVSMRSEGPRGTRTSLGTGAHADSPMRKMDGIGTSTDKQPKHSTDLAGYEQPPCFQGAQITSVLQVLAELDSSLLQTRPSRRRLDIAQACSLTKTYSLLPSPILQEARRPSPAQAARRLAAYREKAAEPPRRPSTATQTQPKRRAGAPEHLTTTNNTQKLTTASVSTWKRNGAWHGYLETPVAGPTH